MFEAGSTSFAVLCMTWTLPYASRAATTAPPALPPARRTTWLTPIAVPVRSGGVAPTITAGITE